MFCLTENDSHDVITIVQHPKSQTVKLKREEEIITLSCHATIPSGLQLEYKWYYLRGNETPATLKRESKTVRSKESSIPISCKVSGKQKWQYFCEVSIASQPECFVQSNVAIITVEYGEF